MQLNQAAANVQANAQPCGLGGSERHEQTSGCFIAHTAASISDGNFHIASAFIHTAADLQSALTRRGFLHGINGVAQQVDEHLLKHDAITLHLCILMVQLNAQFDGVALEFLIQQSQVFIQ